MVGRGNSGGRLVDRTLAEGGGRMVGREDSGGRLVDRTLGASAARTLSSVLPARALSRVHASPRLIRARPPPPSLRPSAVGPCSFLCTEALDADYMAPTAIALLSFPVDHPPFVEALWAQGAVTKVSHILSIYRTLPLDQHDDVLTNAALIGTAARGGDA